MPKFLARIGNAFHALAGKSMSPEAAAWTRAEDVDPNAEGAKLTSPYSQSAWVYIAVSRLAEKISSIPFRISWMDNAKAKRVRKLRTSPHPAHRAFCRRALDESILESGDVVDLFERPHPLMNRQLFWEMVVTWNCLRGEFFILPLDAADMPVDLAMSAPKVQRLITLPTELFWHIVMGYDLRAWRYTGSPLLTPIPSEILEPSEVIHSRAPNPYLFWRGMSPLVVAMVAAGADYAATKYNQGYWLNNADTGVIVTTEQILQPEQRLAIEVALRERKRKAGTADRPLFLFGGAKVEKPQLSGMETTFIDNRKMNRQEIGAIFKVPDSVMGFSDAKSSGLSGGGNALTAEFLAWIENTIAPLCNHLEAAVAPVVKTFGDGLIGWFDLDSLPIMQEARRSRLDTAVKAFGIGVPLNDANSVYDLGFPEYAWGKKSFLPFNLQEVGAPEPLPSEGDDGGSKIEDGEKSNPFARLTSLLSTIRHPQSSQRKPDVQVLWQSHIATRRKAVKLMQAKVGKVLNEFRGTTLAKLDEIHLGKGGSDASSQRGIGKGGSDASSQRGIGDGGVAATRAYIDLIFDQHKFGAALAVELNNPLLHTLDVAASELSAEISLDDPWTMPPQKAKEFLAARKQPIEGVGGTVRDQLNTSLQAGLDAGETTKELADRVRSVFNDMTVGEAKRVAQTETNAAYNFSRHEGMVDSGISYKAWLSSHGPNVRPAHAAAEDYYIDSPIPVDEPFLVDGEELMYPGDPNGSPGNIINCQCIQLAAEKQTEDEKSITFKIFGAGVMQFPKLKIQN